MAVPTMAPAAAPPNDPPIPPAALPTEVVVFSMQTFSNSVISCHSYCEQLISHARRRACSYMETATFAVCFTDCMAMVLVVALAV